MEIDFPVSLEEQHEIKAALQEEWNTSKHIIHLFEKNKALLKKLADVNCNAN